MRFLLIKYPTDYSVENFNILVNITKPPFILHRKMNPFSFSTITPLSSLILFVSYPRSQRGPCLGPVRDPAWPPLSVPPVLRSSHAYLFLLHRKISLNYVLPVKTNSRLSGDNRHQYTADHFIYNIACNSWYKSC